MNLTEVQYEATKIADTRQDVVVSAFFDRMRLEHVKCSNFVLGRSFCFNGKSIEWCDCAYCRALESYIGSKILLHRLQRKIDRDDLVTANDFAKAAVLGQRVAEKRCEREFFKT